MQSLAILIPVALALTALGIWAFLWSVKSDQYDDLDRAASDILFEDEDPQAAASGEREPAAGQEPD